MFWSIFSMGKMLTWRENQNAVLNESLQLQMLIQMRGFCFVQRFSTVFSAGAGTSFVPVNDGNASFWESPWGDVYLPLG